MGRRHPIFLEKTTVTHVLYHAQSSVRLFGGSVEDYVPIHQWFDDTKAQIADFRHRALRHHSEGIFEAERIFNIVIVNSAGKEVPVRYIGEQHVLEDCGGRIPTVADWLSRIQPEPWMARGTPTRLGHKTRAIDNG